MTTLNSIAVYCGSNTGRGEGYLAAAAALGANLGRSGIMLVYGGTHKGLMGALADGALGVGGTAYGVITERLLGKGHLHQGLTRHEVSPSMKERKARMIALADGLVALPGGIGTLEEFMEAWTLNQLGEIQKPIGLFDVDGYYQPFLRFIDAMVAEGFLPAEHRERMVVASEPAALIEGLRGYRPPTTSKWMS